MNKSLDDADVPQRKPLRPKTNWKQVGTDYPEGCVHELFQKQADRAPSLTAIIQGNRRLTYRQLNDRANRLARFLQRRGVEPEGLVGISIDQSLESIVAVLAVLKAGGAYVPLDREHPKARLEEIVRDSKLSLILTPTWYGDQIGDGVATLSLDRDLPLINAECATPPKSVSGMDNAAYVLYTSGSTGGPKGVVGIHRSIVNGLLSVEYAADERCCLNASLGVGFSLANLFLPLICGVPLVVLTRGQMRDLGKFASVLEKEAISRIALAPPVFRQLLELPGAASKLRSVRVVGLAGASLTPDLLKRSAEVIPQARLHNCYSSSEIGTLATLWDVTPEAVVSGEVVIGRPVANTRLYILDEHLNQMPVGIAGEIYVGAQHLARGYLNRPDLTAERFVSDPFSTEVGRRLFRTGDRGRVRPDGEIEFIGRVDEQVKIRGYRIELTEVERALASHKGIRETTVAACDMGGDPRLVAYIVPANAQAPTVRELREDLLARLPDYMVPSVFMFLERLPLLNSGKVDRTALPLPALERPHTDSRHEAPRDPIEIGIAEIWSDLFGLKSVGIHDHFLELGGDSLFAIQVSSRIWDRFRLEVSLESLFGHPTIAELATFITSIDRAAGIQTVDPNPANLKDVSESLCFDRELNS